MGRKNKEKVQTSRFGDEYDWPWTISVDITPFRKPKVCFLSGKEREYFPEDPGFSRFGVEYSMNCAPGDVPNPKYFPSDDRLQKPISNKGYGIGGLSAPRFAKQYFDIISTEPYQLTEVFKPTHRVEGKKASVNNFGNEIKSCEKQQQPFAFGTTVGHGRFGMDSKFCTVGVGHYDLKALQPCKKLLIDNGFGGGPVVMIPPTKTLCNFEGYEECVECSFRLSTTDYYRSRMPIQMPHPKSTPESKKMLPARFIPMCRKCFCNIMRQDHPFWTKRSLLQDFQKTRHCMNIHEHNQLPVFVHKAPCSIIRKLTRKEAVMAKYFSDGCERTIRERK